VSWFARRPKHLNDRSRLTGMIPVKAAHPGHAKDISRTFEVKWGKHASD